MIPERVIYLIHFNSPICPGHPCQHYIGSAADLQARLNAHYQGNGARLTQVASQREIEWSVVRVWAGSRVDERWLKNQRQAPNFCPICSDKPRQPQRLLELSPAQVMRLMPGHNYYYRRNGTNENALHGL